MNNTELKAIRKELRLTQNQLANELKVSLSTVQSWEYNNRNIPEPMEQLILSLKQSEVSTEGNKFNLLKKSNKNEDLSVKKLTKSEIEFIAKAIIVHENQLLEHPAISSWINFKLLALENKIRKEYYSKNE